MIFSTQGSHVIYTLRKELIFSILKYFGDKALNKNNKFLYFSTFPTPTSLSCIYSLIHCICLVHWLLPSARHPPHTHKE